MTITHEEQRKNWNKEHQTPLALKQMDAKKGSSGLVPFLEFLKKNNIENVVGLEMCCGKGRNVMWLAMQFEIQKMYGFDFSDVAMEEAKKRVREEGLEAKTQFDVMDATETWNYDSDFFDFGIDCFGSTDIEDPVKRQFAVDEMYKVIKPGGYFLTYVMSTDDEYHKLMIEKSPAGEPGAFIQPDAGKFEKVFLEQELDTMYKKYTLVEARRIEKTAEFFGKAYEYGYKYYSFCVLRRTFPKKPMQGRRCTYWPAEQWTPFKRYNKGQRSIWKGIPKRVYRANGYLS